MVTSSHVAALVAQHSSRTMVQHMLMAPMRATVLPKPRHCVVSGLGHRNTVDILLFLLTNVSNCVELFLKFV